MSPVFKREEGFVFKIHSNEEYRKHIHVTNAGYRGVVIENGKKIVR